MTRNKGNSLLETKRINRVLIKNAIFRNENIKRSDIANLLELTLPTITTSIQEMINEGFIEEVSIKCAKKATAGRRPNAVAFKADAAYSIGVELGPYYTSTVVMDMKGNILEEAFFPKAPDDYETMIVRLVQNIESILPKGKKILGIGVGVTGFVESETGVIRSGRRKGWLGRPLAEDLAKRLKYPVYIDNNVRLRAIGYNLSMENPGFDTFAYFFVSKGVACPLIIKNEILSGFASGAGELGQNIINTGGDLQETESNFKKVDELGSEAAIIENCNKIIRNREVGVDGKPISGELETIWQVLELQERGCREIQCMVEQGIKYMGIALSQVVNLINPGLVVVDTAILSNPSNQKQFVKEARKYFCGLNEDEVRMVFVPFEKSRGAVGAAYYIIKRLLLDSDTFRTYFVE